MTNSKEASVNEAIGVFSDAKQLASAIKELLQAGFSHSQLGILATEAVVKEHLSDIYERIPENPDPDDAPAIAFVSRDSIGETAQVMNGSLYFIGSSGLAGAVVTSAAVLGGALTAAVGGVLGVGLVGLAVGAMIKQDDAELLQQRVDEGHILLFVRLPRGMREQQARRILARHNATEVKVHTVPIKAGEPVTAD